MQNLCLASASPRRRALLELLSVPFFVQAADIDETPMGDELPADYVQRMALHKAQRVQAEPACRSESTPTWVLSADTTVVADERILGKPAGAEESAAMLRHLSGRTHQVLTAVCLLGPKGTERPELVTTDVTFRALSEHDIACYWATGEPADKAGGYGIQGIGGQFVTHIAGNFHAVVGLPLDITARMLTTAGFDLWPGSPQ